MARIRTIKPEFFMNDTLAELPALDRLIFIGLWTQADREGRLEDRSRKIKAAILPYDDYDVDAALNRLKEKSFIKRYAVKDHNYIEINNFLRHQYPNVKEQASTIPAPYKNGTSISLLRKGNKGKESIVLNGAITKLTELLASLIFRNNPKNINLSGDKKEATIKRWYFDIEKLHLIDSRTVEEIEEVIMWCQNDTFWKSNILSGAKLREKWDQLTAKMPTTGKLDTSTIPESRDVLKKIKEEIVRRGE